MTEKDKNTKTRCFAVFAGLTAGLFLLLVLNGLMGSVNILETDLETSFAIVFRIRFPRVFTAVMLGGALSVSGFLLQTFFNNPIAGPFVLGISSGAKLAVAVVMILLLGQGMRVSSFVMILASFAGSMVCMGFILLFSKRASSMSVLIVAGVMVGYICSAITDFIITFANDADIVNLHNWSMGSFSGSSWDSLGIITLVVSVCLVLCIMLSKQMSAYQMGENYAVSVGVNIKAFRTMLVVLSSLLSGSVTAFAGPISFVGIAVPHLVKSMLKSSKPLAVIPGCFLGGAVFCLFCDLIARTAFAPAEVSISSVTALLGAPVVIYIMLKGKRVM